MLKVIPLVVALAHDFALETRVRRLLEEHQASGTEPRTLVMNKETWHELVDELEGRKYSSGYWWIAPMADGGFVISSYRGIPILIKDFVAYGEVLVGV